MALVFCVSEVNFKDNNVFTRVITLERLVLVLREIGLELKISVGSGRSSTKRSNSLERLLGPGISRPTSIGVLQDLASRRILTGTPKFRDTFT